MTTSANQAVRAAEADAVTDVGACAPGSITQRLIALEENDSGAEKEGEIQVPCRCNFLQQISWMPHRLMAEQKIIIIILASCSEFRL